LGSQSLPFFLDVLYRSLAHSLGRLAFTKGGGKKRRGDRVRCAMLRTARSARGSQRIRPSQRGGGEEKKKKVVGAATFLLHKDLQKGKGGKDRLKRKPLCHVYWCAPGGRKGEKEREGGCKCISLGSFRTHGKRKGNYREDDKGKRKRKNEDPLLSPAHVLPSFALRWPSSLKGEEERERDSRLTSNLQYYCPAISARGWIRLPGERKKERKQERAYSFSRKDKIRKGGEKAVQSFPSYFPQSRPKISFSFHRKRTNQRAPRGGEGEKRKTPRSIFCNIQVDCHQQLREKS